MKVRSSLFLLLAAFAITFLLVGCTGLRPASPQTTAQPLAATGPTVLAVAAQDNGVAPNREIAVTFSDAMDPATINGKTFFITGVDGAVSYDAASKIASLKPAAQLKPLTAYTATVTTGVANTSGQHMAQNYSFSFTTRADQDTSPPTVMDRSPIPGATCVPVNTVVTYTFSEGLDPATINTDTFFIQGVQGTVTYDAVSFKATFTPSAPLQPNTQYSGKSTTGIADLADVHIAGEVPFYFTTAGLSGTCTTGGGGSGSGTNTYVYAGGKNTIAGFSVAADGSATAIAGSPFALAGDALAADPNGNYLFGESSNARNDGSSNTYFSYFVAGNGALTVAGNAQPLPDPSSPGSNVHPAYLSWLRTDRTGGTLYGYGVEGSGNAWINVYSVASGGSLKALEANGGMGQSPISFTPDDHYGYVTVDYHGGGTIWQYTRNADGTLAINSQSQSGMIWAPPAGTAATVPELVEVSPKGNYAAVILADTSSANGQTGISVYPIKDDGTFGTPTPFLPFTRSQDGLSLTWDGTGTYVFLTYINGIAEYHYHEATNQLVPIESEPGSTFRPTDMTFLNGHLFAVNYKQSSLFIFNFDSTTGNFTPAQGAARGTPLPFNPEGIAALQH